IVMRNRIAIIGILIVLVSVRCSQDRDTDKIFSKTSHRETTNINERNFKVKDNLKSDATKRDSIQYRQFNGETKADASETVDPEKVKPPRI
ncbi:hypothetical protein, partial [Elizabethkingia miricola]|uniref:hypothetical protein n=4 Tax=Elizabethkingia miricola TaxID=172045 RepID=UPI001C882785